ncbi:MAG TPA: nucleotide exchange factor GrpE [Solirubrobacteraceae bacterium]|jgi:molecular chaperone GrpE
MVGDPESTLAEEQSAAASTASQVQSPSPGAPAPGEDTTATGAENRANTESADGAQDTASPTDGDGSAELEGDLDELVATAAKRDEYLALAQRTQADFENYRKRMARDSAIAAERGVAKLAKELLPALDNLDRALESAAQDDPLLEGVRLVRSELAAALGRVGIESFSPSGEQFDPELHEAMAQQSVEGIQSGTIAEVYQAGYQLNGTVIRPARVVVAA